MILAVNPKNESLRSQDMREVFSQGELLRLLAENPSAEVLLDRELPGNLKAEVLVNVINKRFPDVQVSIIEQEKENLLPVLYQPSGRPSLAQGWIPYLAAGVVWMATLGVMTAGLPQQGVWMSYAGTGAVAGTIVYILMKGGISR